MLVLVAVFKIGVTPNTCAGPCSGWLRLEGHPTHVLVLVAVFKVGGTPNTCAGPCSGV